MLSDNFGAVFRADYDPVAKTFGNPSIIAGNMNDKSFKEGTGGSARFNKPQFGVFVKNEKYGEGIGPDKDQYDFYFCDRENHCIWKHVSISLPALPTILIQICSISEISTIKEFVI